MAPAVASRRSGRGVVAARRHSAVGRVGWRAGGGELSRCADLSRAASLAAGQPSGGSRQHAESAARLRPQKRIALPVGSAAARRRLRRRAATGSWAGCCAASSSTAARSEPVNDGPRGRRAGGSRWRCRSRLGAAWAARRRQPSPRVAGCEPGRVRAAATASAAAEAIAAASGCRAAWRQRCASSGGVRAGRSGSGGGRAAGQRAAEPRARVCERLGRDGGTVAVGSAGDGGDLGTCCGGSGEAAAAARPLRAAAAAAACPPAAAEPAAAPGRHRRAAEPPSRPRWGVAAAVCCGVRSRAVALAVRVGSTVHYLGSDVVPL